MFLEFFGILSGVLSSLSYIPYIRDILLRKTYPEKATWLIWIILGSIAFTSQLAKGATNSLWVPGLETLGQIIVFILALRVGKGPIFKRKDYIALSIAGLGLVLWYLTHEAAVALYIVIGIDFTGTFLTIQKAYTKPETETFSTWILAMFGGLFSALSVGKFDFILLSYPIFIFAMNGIIALAMILGRKSKTLKR